ncbi:MAG: amidohydrolase, partial [Anaerolineae bacterium]|nr:amidohydrolase [Anaerolineae bacterium]
MAVLDAHLHLWDLSRLSYHWLSPEDTILYRNFTAQEVLAQMRSVQIDSALLVEAANLSAEIPYMLELAQE